MLLAIAQWEIRRLRDKGKKSVKFSAEEDSAVLRHREALTARLEGWTQARESHMGNAGPIEGEDVSPEDFPLRLPSDFKKEDRKRDGLLELAAMELQIRKGHANELISSVKYEVRRRYMLRGMMNNKKTAVSSGEGRVTRQRGKLEKSDETINIHADQYNMNREAMLRLGLDPSDREFPQMHSSDLTFKEAAKVVQLGEGYKRLGWLWTHGTGEINEAWVNAGTYACT